MDHDSYITSTLKYCTTHIQHLLLDVEQNNEFLNNHIFFLQKTCITTQTCPFRHSLWDPNSNK
jgi:hypothetical protein